MAVILIHNYSVVQERQCMLYVYVTIFMATVQPEQPASDEYRHMH